MAEPAPLLPIEIPEEPPPIERIEEIAKVLKRESRVFDRVAGEIALESAASREKLDENLFRIQFTEVYMALKLPPLFSSLRDLARLATNQAQIRGCRTYEETFKRVQAIIARLRRDLSGRRRKHPGFPIKVVTPNEIVVTPSKMEDDKPYVFDFQGATLVAVKIDDESCNIFDLKDLGK